MTAGLEFVKLPRQISPQVSSNVCPARRHKILEQHVPLLVRQAAHHGRVALSFKTQTVAEHHEIDVLGKALDESEDLGQGCPALEEQPRMPPGPVVEQRVEHQADPEVLLHVAWQRIETRSRRFEDIPPVLLRQ